MDTLKWTFSRQQPRGIRNNVEDTANNQITINWASGTDDVTAREESKPELSVVKKAG